MKVKPVSISVLSLFMIVTLSCSPKEAGWKGTIEEKDGVIIVKNPLEPMVGVDAISLEEDLLIGGGQPKDIPSFSLITNLDVDQRGQIYVLDNRESCLYIFDNSGEHLKTIGREGQGPGELQRPNRMYFSPQNEIVIQDMQRWRLNYYSMEGEFLRDILLPYPCIGFGSLFDTEENLIGLVLTRKNGRDAQELRKIDSSFNEMFLITQIIEPASDTYYVGSPSVYWRLMPNNNILFSDTAEYEIKIVNPDNKLLRIINRKYVPVEFTDEEREQWLKKQILDQKVKIADYRPAIRWLVLSDRGFFIVGTFEKPETGELYYYDIFDPEGRYVTRFLKEFQSPPRVWLKDKLYFIEEDEDGFHMVKRYKVTWNY
jgi:hypothetical protein